MQHRMMALIASASLIGCSGDVTSPEPPFVEGLAFAYSGAMTGTFSANGEFDSTKVKPWAGAWRIDGTPLLLVAAISPRGSTTHDAVALVVPRTTPGTSTIASICPPEGCADLLATFGRQNDGGNDFLQGCHIVSGTVTVATINETRVTGSFTGTGLCFSNTEGESDFGVKDGVFDLPILPFTPAAMARRRTDCFAAPGTEACILR